MRAMRRIPEKTARVEEEDDEDDEEDDKEEDDVGSSLSRKSRWSSGYVYVKVDVNRMDFATQYKD